MGSVEEAQALAARLTEETPASVESRVEVGPTGPTLVLGECLTAAEAYALSRGVSSEYTPQVVSRELATSNFPRIVPPAQSAVFSPQAIGTIDRRAYAPLNHHSSEHMASERAAVEGLGVATRPLVIATTGADSVSQAEIEAARQADPTSLDSEDLWASALSCRFRNERSVAIPEWREAAQRGGSTPQGLYASARLGGWLLSDGQREEALTIWEDLVENHPGTEGAGFAQYRLAYLDSAAGSDEAAIARFTEIAEGVQPATSEQRLDAMQRVAAILHRNRDMAGSYVAYRQLQESTDRTDIQGMAGLEVLGLTLEMARGYSREYIGSYEDVLAEYDRLQEIGDLEPYVACRADLMRHETHFHMGDCETALSEIAEFRTRYASEEFRAESLAADKFEAMALMRLGRLDEADAAFAALRENYTRDDAMPDTDPRALALLYRARICMERDEIDIDGAEALLDEFDREHSGSIHADLAADLRATIDHLRGQSLPLPGGSPTVP